MHTDDIYITNKISQKQVLNDNDYSVTLKHILIFSICIIYYYNIFRFLYNILIFIYMEIRDKNF